jgi:hypothetical protein
MSRYVGSSGAFGVRYIPLIACLDRLQGIVPSPLPTAAEAQPQGVGLVYYGTRRRGGRAEEAIGSEGDKRR